MGVLALQGSFAEHLRMLQGISGVAAFPVRTAAELQTADGLILPGGESTAQGLLLRTSGLLSLLRDRIKGGLPVWGTCAGLILLAGEIEQEIPHLGVMDIAVRRNAYGRQLDSFRRLAAMPAFSPQPVEIVCIRAPWIDRVFGRATSLGEVDGHIVAARQDRLLATSFHPELSNQRDPVFHRHFVQMTAEAAERV